MTRRQLRSSVRWESVIIALLGTLLGLVIGVVFAWALVKALHDQGIDKFSLAPGPARRDRVLAALFGVIAAAWPARRAAKLDVLSVHREPDRAVARASLPNLGTVPGGGLGRRGVGSRPARDATSPHRVTRDSASDTPRPGGLPPAAPRVSPHQGFPARPPLRAGDLFHWSHPALRRPASGTAPLRLASWCASVSPHDLRDDRSRRARRRRPPHPEPARRRQRHQPRRWRAT